ncbi:MAG: hypothetical protein WBL19_02920 [Minisyncoccia bacterium]
MSRLSLRQIVGITIWWTEGTKAYKDNRWETLVCPVDVTNTDPRVIKSFLEFLRKDIGINESRLKLQLQIHHGDNQEQIEKYWSAVTKIPLERFTKTIIRPAGNKIGKNKGTCKVRYSDKPTYLRLEKLWQGVQTILEKQGS